MEWVFLGILVVLYFKINDFKSDFDKKLSRIKNYKVGENEMSSILKGLVGQKCKIDIRGNEFLSTVPECEVIDVDEVWLALKNIKRKSWKLK